jgi:uncharacterized membrane protein
MSELRLNLFQKNFFDAEARKKRNKGFIAGIVLVSISGVVFSVIIFFFDNHIFSLAGAPVKVLWSNGGIFLAVSVFLSGISTILISLLFDRRTIEGAKIKAQILGLKKYLTVAEKARLDFHNAPERNPEEFERLLPYAIALGVEKKWAKQFESLSMPPRDWYGGTGTFSAVALSHDLGGGFASSFGGATGAGGSGGGGAGGGGGGGGGGSW